MPDKEALNQTHPIYQQRKEVWQYNADHHAGGRRLRDNNKDYNYLPRFDLEAKESYSNRVRRAMGLFDNLIARSLGVYQSQLFRKHPSRELPEAIANLEEDVDRLGTNATDFFFYVSEAAQLYGMTHVLVDAPKVPEGTSQAEAQAVRIRPYLEHVRPSALIDWSVEMRDPMRVGMLNYVVIKDSFSERPGPAMKPHEISRWRIWTRSDWVVYHQGPDDNEPVEVDGGINELGEVPLVTVYDRRVAPMDGATIIDDVAMASNALWCAASARDENYQYQSFNQLVITSDDETLGSLNLSESRAIRLAVGEDAKYLEPSAVPFEAYTSVKEEITERVENLVFNRTSRQLPSGQVESAEKRNLDRAELIALLDRKATSLEESEAQCWNLILRYSTSETKESAESKISIGYNREFAIDQTTVEDWALLVTQGVRSRIEWIQSENPELTDEEAEARLRENLKLEEELAPSMPALGMFGDTRRDEEREAGEGDEEDERDAA